MDHGVALNSLKVTTLACPRCAEAVCLIEGHGVISTSWQASFEGALIRVAYFVQVRQALLLFTIAVSSCGRQLSSDSLHVVLQILFTNQKLGTEEVEQKIATSCQAMRLAQMQYLGVYLLHIPRLAPRSPPPQHPPSQERWL